MPSRHRVAFIAAVAGNERGDKGDGDKGDGDADADGEHILIYTQWLAHVDYLSEVLADAGYPTLRMSGDLSHCMHCLAQFGQPGQPRILLLSSQHHASGINLQVARHLIIVHPYCTPHATYPEAVSYDALKAYEQQAIGRIQRYPQRRTCHVHRLFATDTVEEMLYRGGYAATRQPHREQTSS